MNGIVRTFYCWLVVNLLVTGCSTLPSTEGRNTSYSLPAPEDSPLVRAVRLQSADFHGITGMQPLFAASDAYWVRKHLIAEATQTVDLQYYIWEMDITGSLLTHELVAAANRGVRIRLLLDDFQSLPPDAGFSLLDAHPNIEIRLFNPFRFRKLKLLDALLDGDRVNHRLHNKMMIADSALAVVGGRNVGDNYFGVHEDSNFRDLDLLLAGTVIQPLAASFDDFWNSRWSIPFRQLEGHLKPDQVRAQTEELAASVRSLNSHPTQPFSGEPGLSPLLKNWYPGEVQLFVDLPFEHEDAVPAVISNHLEELLASAQEELLIENAYFIPTDKEIAAFQRLLNRGVRVRILTNSLATTDAIAAHAGYIDSRKQLVEMGVELYELKPDAFAETPGLTSLVGSSTAALHSKVLVIDRKKMVVGSFNMDPRSLEINTEIALSVTSPSLVREIVAYILGGINLNNSYQVVVNEGQLSWRSRNADTLVEYPKEPEAPWWQKAGSWLLSFLPIRDQL